MTKRKTSRTKTAKKRQPRGAAYQIEKLTCVPGAETSDMATFTFDTIKVETPVLVPLSLQAAVPMKRVSKTVKWPATWWDHFKQDVFPISWQLRWPSRYAELNYWVEEVDREKCPTNPYASQLADGTTPGDF